MNKKEKLFIKYGLTKENYKIFLENNGFTNEEDYPYEQYLDDMVKERAKDKKNFNPRF